MSVPAIVEKLLSKNGIPQTVTDILPGTQAAQAKVLKTTIVQDSQGKVQVIYPGGHIIDLVALRNLLDREVQATNPEDIMLHSAPVSIMDHHVFSLF